jgi:hypothetical protein
MAYTQSIIKSDRVIQAVFILTPIVIIVVTVATITFKEHWEINDIVIPNASILSSAFITVITSYSQSKAQRKRDEIQYEIKKIANDQERLLLSTVKGPLIGIRDKVVHLVDKVNTFLANVENSPHYGADEYDRLQKTKEVNHENFKEILGQISSEADKNRNFIGDIYDQMQTVINYLGKTCYTNEKEMRNNNAKEVDKQKILNSWKDICKSAIHESEALIDHIDYFLFNELDPEDFKAVQFSTALSQNCIIVVGSKRERNRSNGVALSKRAEEDYGYAESLSNDIYEKHKLKVEIITDTDIEIEKRLLKGQNIDQKVRINHIILIGGPRINRITRYFSRSFPLQYVQIKDFDTGNILDNIYSRITEKLYTGENYALVPAFKNPFADNKFIVVAFGSNKDGTKIAVKVLSDIVKGTKNDSNQELKNIINSNYPAKVVLGKENASGIIDDYDLVE